MKKKMLILLGSVIIIVLAISIYNIYFNKTNEDVNNNKKHYEEFFEAQVKLINNYEDYLLINDESVTLTVDDFNDSNYVRVSYPFDSCSKKLEAKEFKINENKMEIYYSFSTSCGLCARQEVSDYFKIDKKETIDKISVYYLINTTSQCDPNIAYKPMIYIYPEHEMDLQVTLKNKDLLTSTYPKYNDSWNILVKTDGTIYDYNTQRNYYALYWEAIDNTVFDYETGFIVAKEDTVSFLEEKLAILGLNDREINEFIVYWLAKLEQNNYNHIYFRTLAEIEAYMALEFDKKPDTLIRVFMDYKALDKPIKIKEQELVSVKRQGYTVVEWGATFHK